VQGLVSTSVVFVPLCGVVALINFFDLARFHVNLPAVQGLGLSAWGFGV
jgi:hypothetical protein